MKFINITILFGIVAITTGCGSPKMKENIVIDGKTIQITDVSTTMAGRNDKFVINKNELSKGLYVEVADNFLSGSKNYPDATAVVRSRFELHGIKTVNKMEETDTTFIISPGGSITPSKANKAAEYSSQPSADRIGSNAGAIAASYKLNGQTSLLGAAIGLMIPVDNEVAAQGRIVRNPIFVKGFIIDSWQPAVKGEENFGSIQIEYKLDKGNEASDDIILKMLTDQWIKKYIAL